MTTTKRTIPVRRLSSVAVVMLAACAGQADVSEPAAPAPAASSDSTSVPFRLPKVIAAMPENAVDLGPVLLTASASHDVVEDFLVAEAERLGADGFVREGRGLREVYAIDLSADAEWRENDAASLAADIGLFILTGRVGAGSFSSPSSASATSFYRAYRILDVMPEPTTIDWAAVGISPIEALVSAQSWAQQLKLAHGMLADGQLDVDAYRRLRAQLVGGAGERLR